MKAYLYKITNTVNGMSYIGQTLKTPQERWRGHISPSSKCTFLKNAIAKYGKDCFVLEVLYRVEMDSKKTLIDHMNKIELTSVMAHGTLAPNGYNIKKGGKNSYRKSAKRRSWKLTQETKDKIAEANTGLKRPWMTEHMKKVRKSVCKPIICDKTGRIWPSIEAAAGDLGIGARYISRCLRMGRKMKKASLSYYIEPISDDKCSDNDT